ncbi:MAG TPA: hypothetical protein DD654_00170 [Leuconostoc lactis]|nr:hypothetical protein [Leuconostoc lactis]
MRLHRCAEIDYRDLLKNSWPYCEQHYDTRMNKYMKAKQVTFDQKARMLRWHYELSQSTKAYDSTRRQEIHDGFYESKQWDRDDLIVDHIIPKRLLPKDRQLDTDNLWLLTKAQYVAYLKTSMIQRVLW